MTVDIKLYADDGTLIASAGIDALTPATWKTLPDAPVVQGDLRYFGWTYQPMVMRASKAGGY